MPVALREIVFKAIGVGIYHLALYEGANERIKRKRLFIKYMAACGRCKGRQRVTAQTKISSSSRTRPKRSAVGKPQKTGANQQPDVTLPPYAGIGRLLRTAHFAFTRLFTLNLAKLGMTFGQFQHLQYLWTDDGITQVELADRIGIRPAASTSILLSLEQSGHIERVRNEIDRRKINVFLTAKGKATKAALIECAKQTNEVAKGDIGERQLRELHRVIGVMVANLTTASSESSSNLD